MMFFQNANFIKSKIIDFNLDSDSNILIGSEVQFGKNRGFADLIVLKDNSVVSYEIKASRDDFRNLKSQLTLYKNVFDYVYTVVTEKHIYSVKTFINGHSGLILLKLNGDIELIRRAKLIKRNKKQEILFSMTIKFLKKYYGIKKNIDSYQIRTVLMNHKIPDIKKAYYNYLKEKLYPKNRVFVSELGEETHFEDVSLLSFNENTEFL